MCASQEVQGQEQMGEAQALLEWARDSHLLTRLLKCLEDSSSSSVAGSAVTHSLQLPDCSHDVCMASHMGQLAGIQFCSASDFMISILILDFPQNHLKSAGQDELVARCY